MPSNCFIAALAISSVSESILHAFLFSRSSLTVPATESFQKGWLEVSYGAGPSLASDGSEGLSRDLARLLVGLGGRRM